MRGLRHQSFRSNTLIELPIASSIRRRWSLSSRERLVTFSAADQAELGDLGPIAERSPRLARSGALSPPAGAGGRPRPRP